MKFRTDINGLRAYAVIAVIIFHFNKQWLSGGFAGVDVFFVISGYLMTSIIFRGLENNNFSIWKFYAARIKRIIPALLMLVIVLMIFGYLFLGPIPYASLAKHSGGSLLFISNIMYWKESGYFDTSAIEKFLLHTWSLSVEWQFYIIYPIGLLILSKLFKLDSIKKIVAVSTILTLIFSIYASQKWTIASYFLLPTRMWEMLLGGIAFLYPFELKKQSEKHILELSGLALILVSFFIITEHTIWPGYAALIPTLGAFILLQANNEKSIFTNNIICQKLGLWSYSLYLWHWSLLATYNYFNYKIKIWPFLFVTLACGITSYYLIERRKWNIWLVIGATLIVLASIFGVYKTNGASFRIDPKFNLTAQEFHEQYYGGTGFPFHVESFINSDSNNYEYFIFGDSFARQYAKFIQDNNIKTRNWFGDGCIFTKNYSEVMNGLEFTVCSEEGSKVYDLIKDEITTPIIWPQAWTRYSLIEKGGDSAPITISNNPDKYMEILEQEIDKVARATKNNIFLIGLPIFPTYNAFSCLSSQALIGTKLMHKDCDIQTIRNDHNINNLLSSVAGKYDNVYYISPLDALCDPVGPQYSCLIIHNKEPIFSDTAHLSIYGAEIVGKHIFNEIRKIESIQKTNSPSTQPQPESSNHSDQGYESHE